MLFGGETARSYYEEGLTSAMKGDLDQAIQYFRRACQMDPSLHQAQYQVGRCLLRQGKTEAALPSLQQAARALPGLSAPRISLGFAFLQLGRLELARDTFAALLQENPDESRAVLGLAYCAFEKGQWETTVNLLQRTLEMGRVQFDTHFLLARAADRIGLVDVSTSHYRKAVDLINTSIEANPEQATGYYLRGRVYHSLGQYSAALEDMDLALQHALPDRQYTAYNEVFSREEIAACREVILKELKTQDEARRTGSGPD